MITASRLEQFILDHNLHPADIARTGACSRRQLFRLRSGTCNARLQTMRALKTACTSLLGRPVAVTELFDVEGR